MASASASTAFDNVHGVVGHRQHHQAILQHAEEHRADQGAERIGFTGPGQREADIGRRHRIHQITAAGVDLRRANT